MQGKDASIFLQAERTTQSGETHLVEFVYNRHGGLQWERRQGDKSFRAVETIAWGNFKKTDPQDRAGLLVHTSNYGGVDYIFIPNAHYHLYLDYIPSFNMVLRMDFRPWVTNNMAALNGKKLSWIKQNNLYRWSGYMLIDNKQLAYYLMGEELESNGSPASYLVLVFDSMCRLVGMKAPSQDYFTPINYIPMVQVRGPEYDIVNVDFNMEDTRTPDYHSRIQDVIKAHPDAEVFMTLNNVPYKFFEGGVGGDAEMESSSPVEPREEPGTHGIGPEPEPVMYSVSDKENKAKVEEANHSERKQDLEHRENEDIKKIEEMDETDDDSVKVSSRGKKYQPRQPAALKKEDAPSGNDNQPRKSSPESAATQEIVNYVPNPLYQTKEYAQYRWKHEPYPNWNQMVDHKIVYGYGGIEWIGKKQPSMLGMEDTAVKKTTAFKKGDMLFYSPTMPISTAYESEAEILLNDKIHYMQIASRQEHEEVDHSQDWVEKRKRFIAFMYKLYTLKFGAVFDRHGEEYSMEEVFFAQDKQGRTYFYAQNYSYLKRMKDLTENIVKGRKIVYNLQLSLVKQQGDQGKRSENIDYEKKTWEDELKKAREVLKDVPRKEVERARNGYKTQLPRAILQAIDEEIRYQHLLNNKRNDEDREDEEDEEIMEELSSKLQEAKEFVLSCSRDIEQMTSSVEHAVSLARKELEEVEHSADQNGGDEDDFLKLSKAKIKLRGAEMLAETGIKSAEFVYDKHGGLIAERLQGEKEFSFRTFVPSVIVYSRKERFRYPVPDGTQYGKKNDPDCILLKGILYTHHTAMGAPFGEDWYKWYNVLTDIKLKLWGVFDKSDVLTTDALHYAVDEDLIMYCLFQSENMRKKGAYVEVAFSVKDESMIGFRPTEAKWFSRMNYSVLRKPQMVKDGRYWSLRQDMDFFLSTWMISHVSSKNYKPKNSQGPYDDDKEDDMSSIHSSDDEETKKKKAAQQRRKIKKEILLLRRLEAREEREKEERLPSSGAARGKVAQPPTRPAWKTFSRQNKPGKKIAGGNNKKNSVVF